jgi:SAM-dependent methyltransferase
MSHDVSLFEGTAPYYRRYRERYDPVFVDIIQRALEPDGTGRLLDVGSGTGNVIVPLADRFATAIGLDPDAEMIEEAKLTAAGAGAANIRWVRAKAEDLPMDLGPVDVITMGQSFHWMDRARMVETFYDMLPDGGAVAIVSNIRPETEDSDTVPWEDLKALVRRYLGPERRAGSGTYRDPGPPDVPFAGSRFRPVERHYAVTGHARSRTPEDILGFLFSTSWGARRLFGDRVGDFERDVRALLTERRPSGEFPYVSSDIEVLIFRKRQG